jgi:hypothetical protein
MEEREKIGSYMESAYYRFQRETRRRWYREAGLSEQVIGWFSLLTATFFVPKLSEGHRPQQPPRCVCVGHRGAVATGLALRCGRGRQR